MKLGAKKVKVGRLMRSAERIPSGSLMVFGAASTGPVLLTKPSFGDSTKIRITKLTPKGEKISSKLLVQTDKRSREEAAFLRLLTRYPKAWAAQRGKQRRRL
jgi:hypothetical protein